MERIPIYTDIDNLQEVFSLDRDSSLFHGMKQLLSKEAELIFCEDEDVVTVNEAYASIALELASGDFVTRYKNADEHYLTAPFKTNLQERFLNKSSVLFSNDTARIAISEPLCGMLMTGLGNEKDVYDKLNFRKDVFRANRILTIGREFTGYNSLQQYLLPFAEIIINEPYLFVPERRDMTLEPYLENNFKSLFRTLFNGVKNKVNITICTFISNRDEHTSPWYDLASKSFRPLFSYIDAFLKDLLGANRYKLWLVISPESYAARHDRYILTNYQYLESGAGLTYFDHNGTFINRGEGLHLYSIMHDDARKSFIPNVITKIQTIVIDNVKKNYPNRLFASHNVNSYYLDFS